MIFRIKGFDLEIVIEENLSPILVIQDKAIFRSIVNSIFSNIHGFSNNDIVLENENGKIINYRKQVVCLNEFFNIDFKSKEIISTLFKKIENNIVLDTEIMKNIEYEVKELGQSIYRVTEDIDLDIFYNSEVTLINLLKLFNFRIDDSELPKPIDKLLSLLSVYADFKLYDVVIFVNLRANYSIDEIKEIYKLLQYKKIKYLCIETQLYDKIRDENIYLIDEDLVESNYLK